MPLTLGAFGSAVRSNVVADSQTNSAWATLLDVGSPEGGRRRLHDRLAHALRAAIRDGRLVEGAAVPPSRALAEELGFSRWVVTEAYGQLIAEGYLSARVGSATRVSWSPEASGSTPPRPRGRRAPATTAHPVRPRARAARPAGVPPPPLGGRRPGCHRLRRPLRPRPARPRRTHRAAYHRRAVPATLARRGRARRVRDRVRGRHRRSAAHVPGVARRGDRRRGRRTPGLGAAAARRDQRRTARAPGARGPRRPRRRRPRAYAYLGRHRRRGTPISHRHGAVPGAPGESGALGPRGRRLRHRGRLRRRVPLRPPPGRRHAGHGSGPGLPPRLGQQDTVSKPWAWAGWSPPPR